MLGSCGLWGHFHLVSVMISRVPVLACVKPWVLQEEWTTVQPWSPEKIRGVCLYYFELYSSDGHLSRSLCLKIKKAGLRQCCSSRQQ